jgi:hypothetical protein
MLAGGLLYVLSIGILEIERISAGLDSFSAISPPLMQRKRHRWVFAVCAIWSSGRVRMLGGRLNSRQNRDHDRSPKLSFWSESLSATGGRLSPPG